MTGTKKNYLYDMKFCFQTMRNHFEKAIERIDIRVIQPEEILMYEIGVFSYIYCGDNYDRGLDLCGGTLKAATGTNDECHRIIFSIRDEDSNYKKFIGLKKDIFDLSLNGRIIKDTIRNDTAAIKVFLECFKYYHDIYLPELYIRMCDIGEATYKEGVSKAGLYKAIKSEKGIAKRRINRLESYLEAAQ